MPLVSQVASTLLTPNKRLTALPSQQPHEFGGITYFLWAGKETCPPAQNHL